MIKTIETLLTKVTESGGFHLLPKKEADLLAKLSSLAEVYEDNTMQLMPIKAKDLSKRH